MWGASVDVGIRGTRALAMVSVHMTTALPQCTTCQQSDGVWDVPICGMCSGDVRASLPANLNTATVLLLPTSKHNIFCWCGGLLIDPVGIDS